MDRHRQFSFVLPTFVVRPLVFAIAGVMTLGACTSSGEELLGAESTATAEASPAPDGETPDAGVVPGSGGTDAPSGQSPAEDYVAAEEPVVEPIEVSVEELPDLPTPEELIPDVESSRPDTAPGKEILDTVDPVDAQTEIAVDRDGRTRNSAGELIGLDQPASLACANVEISLTSLDEGDDEAATVGITRAVAYAEQSEMTSVKEWSTALADSIVDRQVTDFAPLIGFLTACASGGYEL